MIVYDTEELEQISRLLSRAAWKSEELLCLLRRILAETEDWPEPALSPEISRVCEAAGDALALLTKGDLLLQDLRDTAALLPAAYEEDKRKLLRGVSLLTAKMSSLSLRLDTAARPEELAVPISGENEALADRVSRLLSSGGECLTVTNLAAIRQTVREEYGELTPSAPPEDSEEDRNDRAF